MYIYFIFKSIKPNSSQTFLPLVKMKFLTLFALIIGLAVTFVCAADYTKVSDNRVKIADKNLIEKQNLLLQLLQHIHQNDILTDVYEQIKDYLVENDYNNYNNVEQVKSFVKLYHVGLLPITEIFSLYNVRHRNEAIAVFRVLFNAKDWQTFYKFAAWSRFFVNKGVFLYALTVATIHRTDFAGIQLPAPYEIYPYYFFDSDTIELAQKYKMQNFYGMKPKDDTYTVVIPSNYTNSYFDNDQEHKLAYYREDIGLNAMYYYHQIDYPFWLGGPEYNLYKDRRGEHYLYLLQQYVSRYYMERLSNGLGIIPDLSFYEPIKHGYSSSLRYFNGIPFQARENDHICSYHPENFYGVTLVEDYEQRIRDAIDSEMVVLPDGTFFNVSSPDGIDVIGNMVQSNPDSKNSRYYKSVENLSRMAIGGTFGEHFKDRKVIPSVLRHQETSMRDPVSYQMYKRIVKLYWQFMDKFPSYKYEEIAFNGVNIESVDIDKLVTYFDKFDSDITNAVNVVESKDKYTDLQKFGRVSQLDGKDFVVKARQWRLNHLPFTIKLNIDSEKDVSSVIRVFMAPKYDEFGREYKKTENRENWYFLDYFKYDLIAGKNNVIRKSQDMFKYVKDRTTYYDLYKWIMLSKMGKNSFTLDMTEGHNGVPNRLMLPRGKKGGMTFRFYFIVSPYIAPTIEQYKGYDPIITAGIGSGSRYLDDRKFGYPLDRIIDDSIWYTPNMFYLDTNIFHKTDV